MTCIPDDILAEAKRIEDEVFDFDGHKPLAEKISRAILAERKRCADIADKECKDAFDARLIDGMGSAAVIKCKIEDPQ